MTRVLTRDRQRRQAEQEARGTMEAGGPYAAAAQDGSELPGLEEAEGLSAGASGGREGARQTPRHRTAGPQNWERIFPVVLSHPVWGNL